MKNEFIEEEKKLIAKAQCGDERAWEILIERYEKLISFVARNHNLFNAPTNDIKQEAYFGFVQAVKNFDLNMDVRLSTYALSYICKYVVKGIYNGNIVKIPEEKIRLMNQVKFLESEYYAEHGHFPSDEFLADILDVSIDRIKETHTLIPKMVSFDQMYSENDDEYVFSYRELNSLKYEEDFDKNVDTKNLKAILDVLLDKISVKQKEAISLYYDYKTNEKRTLTKIGSMQDCSYQCVSTTIRMGIHNIRKLKDAKKLALYCDFPDKALKFLDEYNNRGGNEVEKVIDYNDINSLTEEELNEIMFNFTVKQESIILLKLGYMSGKCYTDEEIIDYLSVDQDEIDKTMSLYKDLCASKVKVYKKTK